MRNHQVTVGKPATRRDGCLRRLTRYILIGVCLNLGACASVADRFPNYAATASQRNEIPVLIDVVMFRDIAGFDSGYNIRVNEETQEFVSDTLEASLTQFGYKTQLVGLYSGLSEELDKNQHYVISEDWVSTGQPLQLPQRPHSDDPWLTMETQAFLRQMLRVAPGINARLKTFQRDVETEMQQGNQDATFLINMPLSGNLFEDIRSDHMLYVRVSGRYQQLSKFLTKGVVVGALSSALTGGLVFVPTGSYAVVDIVAIKPSTRDVLWYARGYGEGKKAVNHALDAALLYYPYRDGETHFQKKRRQKREFLKGH